MTEEELNRLEAVVRKRAALGDIDPEPSLSLIALARLGLAVTPRPIAEAPRDGMMFLAYSEDLSGNGLTPFWSGCAWHDDAGFCTDEIREPTHFIPISAIPKPGGE